MPTKKKPIPVYNKGDKVFNSILGKVVEVRDSTFNGLTWMYSFKDESLSCGGMYLRRATEAEVEQ